MTSAAHPAPAHSWRTAFIAVVLLAGLIALVLHWGDVARFSEMARAARPAWLGAAFAFQGTTYVFLALGWSAVLRRAGSPQPLRRLVRIAFSKLFVDQVVPAAGMSGNVLLVDRLTALGTPRGAAMAALLVSLVGYYAVYAVLACVMLLALWLHHAATPLAAGLVTLFLLVALAIPALALWARRRGRRSLPAWIERLPPFAKLLGIVGEAPAKLVQDRPLIARVALWNGMIFLADAATLAVCLHALGGPLVPVTAFIALMAASIAVTLAPLPMGLGSFEATCTAMLALLGIPAAAALAATLLLRMLTLWLPLVPGMWIMTRAKRTRKARR